MKSSFYAKTAAIAAIALGSLALAQAAQAHTDVYFSLGASAPVYAAPQPVYVDPQPVYVEPQPVYVDPQPAYVTPAPVYGPVYSGYDNWRWRQQEWRREEWRREHWRREEWRRHHDRDWDGHR